MSENPSENSEMSSVEFSSEMLKRHVAPSGSAASVSARIRLAARRLGWTYSRTRDVWYADPRVSIGADEIRAIEETTGVRYGRQEARELDALIARADAILDRSGEDIRSAFAHALSALVSAFDRPGA